MSDILTENERRCLIGVADNQSSLDAFDFYTDHLHQSGNKVTLVYVLEPVIRCSNQLLTDAEAARERRVYDEKCKVTTVRQLYEDKMRQAAIEGRINIIYYSPHVGKVLCQVAREEHCSMIVVAAPTKSKQFSPLQPILGNVIDYVLRKSHCPVIVYRNDNFDIDQNVLRRLSLGERLREREEKQNPMSRKVSRSVSLLSGKASWSLICDHMTQLCLCRGVANSGRSSPERDESVDDRESLVSELSIRSDDKRLKKARRYSSSDVPVRQLKSRARGTDSKLHREHKECSVREVDEVSQVTDRSSEASTPVNIWGRCDPAVQAPLWGRSHII